MTLETIWIHYSRPRPHWYDLPDAERERLSGTWRRLGAEVPEAQPLGRYHVRGLDDFERVEIWKFPSPDAAFAHWRRLAESGYPEWHSFRNSVGLALGPEQG